MSIQLVLATCLDTLLGEYLPWPSWWRDHQDSVSHTDWSIHQFITSNIVRYYHIHYEIYTMMYIYLINCLIWAITYHKCQFVNIYIYECLNNFKIISRRHMKRSLFICMEPSIVPLKLYDIVYNTLTSRSWSTENRRVLIPLFKL